MASPYRYPLLVDLFVVVSAVIMTITPIAQAIKETRWHLQRIVQRDKLSEGQLESGAQAFDLHTIQKKHVHAYIIDSGIRITHQEFSNGRARYGINIQSPASLPTDCNGHGTHVAALLGGSTSGVAANTKLVAVRVLDCNGKGTCADMLAGLEWVATDHRLRQSDRERSVAVMSIGSKNDECRATLQATQKLWDGGVVITAAAGNKNLDACDLYPARNPRTIAVGGVDKFDRVFAMNNHGDCVDLFGPGVDVYSAWGAESDSEWKELSGSSMAAPIVAGTAAVILGADSSLLPAEVRQIILSSTSRNRILAPTGTSIMVGSANRLIYAPWSKLFDEVKMNRGSDKTSNAVSYRGEEFPIEDPDWNSSSSFLSLSMTLAPKTSPAMHFAVTRISAAIASAAELRTTSILPRRVAGMQISSDGQEPKIISLVFYIPVHPSLIETYRRRLISADESGKLLKDSKENISFASGSLRNALLINVSVPPIDLDGGGDRFEEVHKQKNNSLKIAMIAVGTVLGLALLVAFFVLFVVPRFVEARNHREAVREVRSNRSIIVPSPHGITSPQDP